MSALYSAFCDLADARRDMQDELRAEAAAERARYRTHFCDLCMGFTGPGSPCAPEETEPNEEDEQCEP